MTEVNKQPISSALLINKNIKPLKNTENLPAHYNNATVSLFEISLE